MSRTVLVYGDSNSHGTEPMPDILSGGRLGPSARWPGVMAAALGDGWRLIEEALPGRTTVLPDPISGIHKNGLAILPAVLESHAPLDLVIVMLGTNDLKARFQMPPLEVAVGLEQLVRHIAQDTTGPDGRPPKLLVIAPPPVEEAGCLAEVFEGAAAKSRRLAGYYQAVADRWGAAFFDAGGVIAPSALDGVHFDAQAHGRLGAAVAGAVAKLNL